MSLSASPSTHFNSLSSLQTTHTCTHTDTHTHTYPCAQTVTPSHQCRDTHTQILHTHTHTRTHRHTHTQTHTLIHTLTPMQRPPHTTHHTRTPTTNVHT